MGIVQQDGAYIHFDQTFKICIEYRTEKIPLHMAFSHIKCDNGPCETNKALLHKIQSGAWVAMMKDLVPSFVVSTERQS